ncbi:MAG: hypothetical protein CMF99_07145 [Candidatus Marinimicrobia bacterium]|nr:hypothetical protein [Candidatus Neomarinimicrobiota bacterium]
MKRRPLFLKLFYTFFPLITLGVLLLILAVNISTQNFYKSLIEQQLKDRTSNIFNWLKKTDLSEKNIQYICNKSSNNKRVRITIVNNRGTVVGDSHKTASLMDNHLNRPEIKEAISNGTGLETRFSNTLQKELMYYASSEIVQKNTWIVRVSIPIDEYSVIISDLQYKIILFGLVVSFALLYLSYFISKQITAPIDNMRKKTEQYVSTLQTSRPLDIPKTKELASLALSLNKMAKELDERIKQIQDEKEDKESLLSSMQEGIIAINKKGKIISINDIGIDYLNITTKEILKQHFSKIIKHKKLLSIIETSIEKESKTHHVFEQEIAIKRHKKRFFLINSSPLVRSNNYKGVLIILNDITLRKQLEKVRQDFVANVSHELKTPITSIVASVEILDRDDLTKNERDQFLEKILNHTNRMNAIIDDLLKLSKIESQEEDDSIFLQEQDLFPILLGAKQDIENSSPNVLNNIEIICNDDVLVKGDSQLLREAFLNLLENAGKYGFPNTPIQISAEKKKRLHIHFDNKGNEIKEKHWGRIFQRFYRVDKSRDRKAGGTGLGLAIVKHIIFVHQGEIKVSSSENKKTRFTITLPLVSKG